MIGEYLLTSHNIPYSKMYTSKNASHAICMGKADVTFIASPLLPGYDPSLAGCNDLKILSKPLHEVSLFSYLNKKHSAKIETMRKAIYELKMEGTLQKINKKYFNIPDSLIE